MLKRKHSYYFQVQQQLFTLPERKFNEFVVCAIDSGKNEHLEIERIYPDPEHSNAVLPKLEAFWRICILPEILGRWFTRRCDVLRSVPNDNSICFCRSQNSEYVVSCSDAECLYRMFHITWYHKSRDRGADKWPVRWKIGSTSVSSRLTIATVGCLQLPLLFLLLWGQILSM